MPKSALIALSIVLFCFALPVQTDIFGPTHSCSKPYKPYQFHDEWQLQRFKDEVEDYRRCIEEFVDEQNESIRNHQKAIGEAIDDWQNFVNYELN